MATVTQLTAALGVDSSEFTRGLDKAAGQLLNFKELLGKTNVPMIAVGTALGGLAVSAVQTSLDFQQAFGNIAAQTGATGDALDKLTAQFSGNYLKITQGSDEASAGFARLKVRTDLTSEGLNKLFLQESAVARFTGQNLVQTIDDTTTAMNKWGIASDQMAGHLDRMVMVTQQSGVGMNKLAEYLRAMGAPLQDMGFSFDHAATLLGKWDHAGINVSQTTFGLRHAMNEMVEAGIKPSAENMEILIATIEKHKNTAEAAAEMSRLFGKRSGEELIDAMRKGKFGVEDFTRTLESCKDVTKRTDDAVNPLGKGLIELKHAFEEAIKPSPEFQNNLQGDVDVVKTFFNWISKTNTELDKSQKKKGSMWEQMFGSQKATKEEMQLSDQSNYTEKMKNDLYWTDRLGEAWDGIKGDIAAEDIVATKAIDNQTDKHKKLLELLKAKPKHIKLTPDEREWKQLKTLGGDVDRQLESMGSDGVVSLSKLEAKFGNLGHSAQALIHHIAAAQTQLKNIATVNEEWRKFDSMLEQANHKIVVLRSGGEETRASLHDLLPHLHESDLDPLVHAINLHNQLKKSVEDHAKAVEAAKHLEDETNNRMADANAELLRLTHTRYEDIAALELYKKPYAELTDLEHAQNAFSLGVTLQNIDQTKQATEETKRREDAAKGLARQIDALNLKLVFKGPLDESAQSVTHLQTKFDDLNLIIKSMEREDLTRKIFGDDATFGTLEQDYQGLIDNLLRSQHAYAILTKEEVDHNKALLEEHKLTDELNKKYDELQGQISKLNNVSKTQVVHSELIVNMLMNIADGADYTAEQIKKMWKVFDDEAALPGITKQAQLIKKLTDTMRQEFSKLFDDIAMGHKNAFASIVQDFEQMLAKIAADYLASRITDLIMGLVGSLGGHKTIAKHATGGTMAPGELALVGENGPELFRANAAGTVIPNGQSAQGQSGGVNVYMTVITPDANSFRNSRQQTSNDIMSALQRAQMRNG